MASLLRCLSSSLRRSATVLASASWKSTWHTTVATATLNLMMMMMKSFNFVRILLHSLCSFSRTLPMILHQKTLLKNVTTVQSQLWNQHCTCLMSHLLHLLQEVVAQRQLLVGCPVRSLPGLDGLDGQWPQLAGNLFRRGEGLLRVCLHRQLQKLLKHTRIKSTSFVTLFLLVIN